MNKVTLGSIISLQKGKKPKNISETPQEGFLPYVDIKAFEQGIFTSYTDGEKCVPCEDGDLLIVCDGSRSGLVGRAKKGYVGSTLAKISAQGMDSNYLTYFLQGKYQTLNTNMKGTGTPHVNPTLLKSFTLVAPSIPEQEQIVQKIEELFSELDKGVMELKAAQARLKVYRQAVLKDAFEGKWNFPTRLSANNFPPLPSTVTKKLPCIPNEWQYTLLQNLGELARGKSKHRPRNDKELFKDGKYPFIQTGDVKSASNTINNFSKSYGEFGLKQSKLWKKGTLCITIAANIAETAFLGLDACFPDSIVGFDPDVKVTNKKYIRYFIESSKIRLWAFAPATAQKNINLTTLENLVVPYCSLEEQQFIVTEIESRLSVCDNIEQNIGTSLEKAESLRQSILKKAFEGELV